MEMSVVPNFDINWNELEQIEIDDELENTFLRLTALDVPLNIHIDENTIVTVELISKLGTTDISIQ
jgi:hypothetical protein